jgi:hypothetical protein
MAVSLPQTVRRFLAAPWIFSGAAQNSVCGAPSGSTLKYHTAQLIVNIFLSFYDKF